jgi:hypothetical protein
VHGYVLDRLRRLSETNDLNAARLVEGGLHFAESVGRLVPRLASHPDFAQDGSVRESVNVYLRFLEWYQHQAMEPWLEQAARQLVPALDAFAAAPSAATAEPWLRRVRDAGHILEITGDAQSWFHDRVSPVERRAGAEALAAAALRWYSPELAPARAALDGIQDAEGRALSLLLAGHWMHAHHGLVLWLAGAR